MKIEKQKDRYVGYSDGYKVPIEFMEKNSGEILTIQNDSFSIRELLEKFTTNQFPSEVMRNGLENDMDLLDINDTDIETLRRVDITEVEEFAANVAAKVKASSKRVKQSKAKEQEAKQSEAKSDDAGDADQS